VAVIEQAAGPMGPFLAQAAHREALVEAHLLHLHRHYLEPWRAAGGVAPPQEQGWLHGLIVDTRPSERLLAVVANTLVLAPPGTRVTLITQPAQLAAMEVLLEAWLPWLELLPLLPDGVFTIELYNALLCDPRLWERWPGRHVLVFQSDGVMLRPLRDGEGWQQWGYLGAAWFRGERWAVLPCWDARRQPVGQRRCSVLYGHGLPEGVLYGNGGFSLRASDLMRDLCSRFDRPVGEPEDVFVSRQLQYGSWPLAPLEVAAAFAVETLFHPDPVGMHASWAYLSDAQQARLLGAHLRVVAGLCSGR
jgi:hypothetical protein